MNSMISKGSKTFRHDNSITSAKNLLHHLLPDLQEKITLDLQQQMVNEKKSLDETNAGMEVLNGVATERNRFLAELQAVREQMQD